MSNIQINVRVNASQAQRGLDQTGRSADRARKRTDNLARSLSSLRRVMGFLGFGILVSGLTEYADAVTGVQNRLRILESDTTKLAQTTKDLKRVADETRSSFTGSAELYQRVGLASRNLGRENTNLLGIVKSVNQAIILSGATAKEANNGLIQLSQGIAANRLGGDELRSVLEQLPVVADVIAESMGITRGELRAFGEQGKITGDVVLTAFEQAAGKLDRSFGRTIPTIGESLQVLKNNLMDMLGDLNQGQGVFSGVAFIISKLAANIRAVAAALAIAFAPSLFTAVNAQFVSLQVTANKALKSMIGQLLTFKGILGGLALGGIGLAVAFREEIMVVEDDVVTLGDVMEQTFEDAGNGISTAFNMIGEQLESNFNIDFTPIQGQFRDFALFMATGFDGILNVTRGLVAEMANAFDSVFTEILLLVIRWSAKVNAYFSSIGKRVEIIFTGIAAAAGMMGAAFEQTLKGNFLDASEMQDQAMATMRGAFDAAGKAGGVEFNRALAENMDAVGPMVAELEKTISPVGELFKKAIGPEATSVIADGIGKIFANAQARKDAEILKKATSDQQAALDAVSRATGRVALSTGDLTRKYRDQEAALRAQIQGGEDMLRVQRALNEAQMKLERKTPGATLSPETRKAITEQVEYNNQLQRVADLMQQINGPQQEMVANQRALKVALDEGVISLYEFNSAMALLKEENGGENSFAEGLAVGLEKVRERVFDLTTSVSNAVQNVATATEDFLAGSIEATTGFIAKLVVDGKASFSDFKDTIRSLFADLISAMIQELSRLMAQKMMMQILGMALGPAGMMGNMAGVSADAASAGFNASMAGMGAVMGAPMPQLAVGGTAIANHPYLVGEQGPEIFFPGKTGSVMTNQQSLKAMEAAMGGGNKQPQVVQAPAPQVNVSPQIVLDPSQVVSNGLNDDMIIQAISRNASQVRGTVQGM